MPRDEARGNPYRPEQPAVELFFGRRVERERLGVALKTGAEGIAAIMGGRGMGKTSLAQRLRADLGGDLRVAWVPRPRGPADVLRALERALGGAIQADLLDYSIADLLRDGAAPLVLIIDEVEGILSADDGPDLLEGLRVTREQPEVGDRLRILVMGGSMLRDLLERELSPFLRSVGEQWLPLCGLDLTETQHLACDPLGLVLSEDTVRRLWDQTGGHPCLLQRVLRRAVDLSLPWEEGIEAATRDVEGKAGPLFEILWSNLRPEGQAAYLGLLESGPVPRDRRLERIGNNPDARLEVLSSTGVVWLDPNGTARAHGAMFARWVQSNITGGRARASPSTATDPTRAAHAGAAQNLSGAHLQALQEALLDAFQTKAELEQMVRFGLSLNLAEIAGGENLREVTFALLRWANEGGHAQVRALFAAALRHNPNNEKLALAAAILDARRAPPTGTDAGR